MRETHLLQQWRHGGLHVRPGDLGLQRRIRDGLLGAVVEGDDGLGGGRAHHTVYRRTRGGGVGVSSRGTAFRYK